MKLKSIDQIAIELQEKIINWEAEMKALGIPEDEATLDGLALESPGLDSRTIQEIEEELSISLPDDFKNLIRTYSFCGIEICDVTLGAGDLKNFIVVQKNGIYWERWERDPDQILLGNGESDAIVLDCKSRSVIGIPVESDGAVHERLATSFELFVQALGTVFLTAPSVPDMSELSEKVGCQSDSKFWTGILHAASKKRKL